MSVSSTNPITPVTAADLNAHTEQSLIELVYVRTSNEVISSSLASLDQALTLTKGVLDTLTGIQNLHNRVTAQSKGKFNFPFTQGQSNYAGAYTTQASAFFGEPIVPVFGFSSVGASGFSQYQASLLQLRDQLTTQIPQLSATTPPLSGGGEDPNSLLAKLRTVLGDLNSYNLNTFNGVKEWALDKYDTTGSTVSANAGLIQQNLTFAITAGESLNDTQKETVRRYLFVFEEYYKSASTILTKISQLIEKMGQSISR